MAKAFGGLGAQRMTANPIPGSTPPPPRPAGLGGVEVQQATKPKGGFLAQQFGPQGSDARYEMAMTLLKSAMSSAAGSNSPVLAFLTPILGAAMGTKLEKQRGDYLAQEQNSMAEAMLGGPLNPQAQQAMSVLDNPDAPAYLKDIARTMLKNSTVPVGQMAKPARRSSGGGAPRSPRPARLTYIKTDPDGITRGYNADTGKREVVPNADAAPPPPIPAQTALALPPDPILPQDPAFPTDDDLLNKY